MIDAKLEQFKIDASLRQVLDRMESVLLNPWIQTPVDLKFIESSLNAHKYAMLCDIAKNMCSHMDDGINAIESNYEGRQIVIYKATDNLLNCG